MGLGRLSPARTASKKAPKSSSKVRLIDGEVPTYKGDVHISMDESEVEPLVVTVFGPPGVGKTTFAMTFPRVAICDTEMKGEKVWRQFYRGQIEAFGRDLQPHKWSEEHGDPTLESTRLFHAEDWGDVAAFWTRYANSDEVDTLVFDSETDLREMAELWILKVTGKSLYGGDGASAKVPYANVFGMLKYVLTRTKSRGKHVVYTGKEKDKYDKSGNVCGIKYDGYNKQFFFSGYVIYLRQGVETEAGDILYPKHVFGEVIKVENMRPGYYPPYLVECNYRGLVKELVQGSEWTGSKDDFIREVITPRMKELGVSRE
ncbi:MAG: AAA family ATPase [Deltaproteobacteria bacterium]|nr:AAA family ATPase [Deltaproteobacteria bacterium]